MHLECFCLEIFEVSSKANVALPIETSFHTIHK
jgi:hypothetical protein